MLGERDTHYTETYLNLDRHNNKKHLVIYILSQAEIKFIKQSKSCILQSTLILQYFSKIHFERNSPNIHVSADHKYLIVTCNERDQQLEIDGWQQLEIELEIADNETRIMKWTI